MCFNFDRKVYALSVILHVTGILYFYGVAAQLVDGVNDFKDGQSNITNNETAGVGEELLSTSLMETKETYQDVIQEYNFPGSDSYRLPQNKRCPLCDSSVYPYCGEKLLHDACCCTDFYIQDLPHQCKLADCRFLHANSCREHRLIAVCCCNDDYRSLLKNLSTI